MSPRPRAPRVMIPVREIEEYLATREHGGPRTRGSRVERPTIRAIAERHGVSITAAHGAIRAHELGDGYQHRALRRAEILERRAARLIAEAIAIRAKVKEAS